MNQAKKSQGTSSPIDIEDALARIGGDPDFLRELLDLYIEDFSFRYALLDKAVHRGDLKAIAELGHTIKGSSANLSLSSLQEHAFELEKAGKNGDLGKARASLAALGTEFRRLKVYMATRAD
jgi:HPt (histidine-containing phosphotransfer) domain-containing protein